MSDTEQEEGMTSAEMEQAIEASEREAKGKPVKIFKVGDDIELILPYKWKRAKFLKNMGQGDIWAALESIWPKVPVSEIDEDGEQVPVLDRDGEQEYETHPELAKLEEADMDEDDFQLLMERLGETLMGRRAPKGKASGRSSR